MRNRRTGIVALGLAASAVTAAPALAATAGPLSLGSTALGLDAKFTSEGVSSELGPIALVTGGGSGKYDQKAVVGKLSESVAILPRNPTPTVFANAKNIVGHTSSAGWGVDSISSEADASLDTVAVSLNLNPPPPGSAIATPQPFLDVVAREVNASANYSTVIPMGSFATGSAGVGVLRITGQIFGGATLKYSGAAPPNTVIYDTPTVTVTLNRQIRVGLISCTPNCKFTPNSIDVAAIDIQLNKAVMYGHKISGEIAIGEASAR